MKKHLLFTLLAAFAGLQISFAQTTETRSLSKFKKLSVEGFASITLIKGERESAKISVRNIELSDVTMKVIDNTLRIGLKKHSEPNYYNNGDVRIELTYRKLSHVHIAGACNLKSKGVVKADEFRIIVQE